MGLVAPDPQGAGAGRRQAAAQPATPSRRDQRASGRRTGPGAEGQAQLQDGYGRGRAPRDVPASGEEGRLTETTGIFDLREGPHQAAAVAERIWNAFWRHKGTSLATMRDGLDAILKTETDVPVAPVADSDARPC